MSGILHIIGGGMAGLAAAVEVAGTGTRVIVHEAGRTCGGRARSYHDRHLDCRIDNGNHLLLSANSTMFRYLGITGALDTLSGPGKPVFPFVDLAEDARWTLDLSRGRLPLWVFQPHRRVPDMRLPELQSLYRLIRADDQTTVADCLLPGAFTRRLLEPFSISALNTLSDTGSAALLGAVVRESLSLGGHACVPWFARDGLSESLVDPAVAYLESMNAEIRTQTRITGMDVAKGRVTTLHTAQDSITLSGHDKVIVATTAPVAEGLLSQHMAGLITPNAFESILNLHFRLAEAPRPVGSFAQCGFMGVIGGVTEWVFLRGNILSVTVSAANRYAKHDHEELARIIWSELRSACDAVLEQPLPPAPDAQRIVWEKRATFAATPEQNRRRPGSATPLINLALAGDWTNTGLPATLEGAMRSGLRAVHALGLKTPS
ncbi:MULTISPECIES: hydroxysqualene dehydroxylase HpnE [Acetobacter]|jgi:squalene-associated FAD-dependent desaturase|uniref:Squalene-associated FAD-dependent desaturase n=1 Tax=Acetobacter lovaniensis TaxID=104100 RepID=A0A841QEC4_9PROT|nr:hydroxysqualene dehydroxylase HpnE [Acetobacter lovaniensis]MBB6457289.1 squalene-associated FAD-dependent desaturase [Acetobacter lovaniensis]MCI1795575.1 hydroxysqualene dehydroxylase HpnE [Acetobacter lovaniensis]MCP1239679.1 hydroxysqualene dehydroxylase HpnE [Acetobacter lovaniensis]NHN81657.1 NAD(P)-binding protein [Acetobacter lovaniensis]GBQ63943.1 phytoene desaturase [Acetobacter lovaniensis NRIC 0474]